MIEGFHLESYVLGAQTEHIHMCGCISQADLLLMCPECVAVNDWPPDDLRAHWKAEHEEVAPSTPPCPHGFQYVEFCMDCIASTGPGRDALSAARRNLDRERQRQT